MDAVLFTFCTTRADLETVGGVVGCLPGPVALDLETTGLNPRRDKIRLMQLAVGAYVFVIDVQAVGDIRSLFPALAARELVLFNAAFDLAFLWQMGFRPGKVCDLLLLARLLSAGTKADNTLAAVTKRELGIELPKDFQTANWAGQLSPAMLAYAARDVRVTMDLYKPLWERIRAAELETIADIENRAVLAMVWMACSGMPWYPAAWETLAVVARREEAELKEQLHVQAPPRPNGKRWNWMSPEHVKEALALAGIDLPDTQDSTLAGVDHPLAHLLRKHRHASHLVKSFGKSWLGFDDGGRIYASWNQLGADSGRTSCNHPNLQQVPRKADYRSCFVAPPGRILVKADYSQLQLRIAAKIANDTAMLQAFQDGADLHTLTARQLTGKTEVSKADRQLAKAVNFGLLFGLGAEGLRSYAKSDYDLDLTEAEAKRYRQAFFTAYPGLAAWHRHAGNSSAGECRTPFGRRRLLDAKTPYTHRLNSPVQGAEADGAKLAMALLWERRGECPGASPVGFVHDELVVEADESRAEATATWLQSAMIDGMAEILNPVPATVELSVRKTWAGNDVPVLPLAGANGVVMAATPLPPLITKICYWMTEREAMRRKKEAGEPLPLSEDPILADYRWTNCRRWDDRVSRWLCSHWYDPKRGHPHMVPAVVLARHLNRIDTLEVVGFPEFWDPAGIKAKLHNYEQTGKKAFGAYVIPGGAKGRNKIDHVIDQVVQPFFDNPPAIHTSSMEKTWKTLRGYPGMGSFLAGQVVADLRFAVEGTWADKDTWAPMGPGSQKGINRLFGRDPDERIDQEQFLAELHMIVAECKKHLPEAITSRLEMADWQNIACEANKYLRTLAGEGKPKQKYRPPGAKARERRTNSGNAPALVAAPATTVPQGVASNAGPDMAPGVAEVLVGNATWAVVQGDRLEFFNSLPANSIDLVFGSPPYERARTYGIDFALSGEDWVRWMVDTYRAALRVCRGLVAFVLEGTTKNYRWSAVPALLMADLHRAGVHLRRPPVYHRVGIPGSGGPDWLRSDTAWIVCATRGGKLRWSDPKAMGHEPKYAPGGEMSYRNADGSRVNKRLTRGSSNENLTAGNYSPPEKANPGNVIHLAVGGGLMGNNLCHENEAPFPEALAEFFIRSFCPPGGIVADCFSGSGTTGAVAVREGRRFVGCDVRESQVELSRQRIALPEYSPAASG
jgi:DNA polymerase-1